ncbi:MAG: hypothetical protein ACM30G_05240, partial [Micromonosporaceae bacterium]
HPALVARADEIHALLANADTDASGDATDGRLADELIRISGLELNQLRVLYRSTVRRPGGGPGSEIIDAVLADDPHKAVIQTRHTRNGPHTLELISGR